MEDIVLYSAQGCTYCAMVKRVLETKHISHTISYDVNTIADLGFQSLPVLLVDGKYMNRQEALGWLNAQEMR